MPILLELARLDAHVASRRLTSAELARRLATSQQTAARWLVELEREGLIKREAGPRGQSVRLTSTGLAIIRSVYHDLDAIFRARARVLKLVGRVTSGIGEGSYYVCQEGYRRQFKRVLGFDPYPGTLDLKLDEESLELKGVLQSMPGKHIEGFITPERTFGPVKCFSAKLRGVKVAIVIPSRTHLTDAIELIAPKNLRKKLGLKDGDRVKLEVRV